MAICVRRLVEDNEHFRESRIAYNATNNLPQNDDSSLTTIGNLYDVLGILFSQLAPNKKAMKELQFNRPDDDELDEYYGFACEFFEKLAANYRSLRQYFKAKDVSTVVAKYRGDFGGSILFRPAGLRIVTEVIASLNRKCDDLDEAIAECASLPEELKEMPYSGLIWDSTRSKMAAPLKTALTRDLLLFMLNAKASSSKLAERYAKALGRTGSKNLLKELQESRSAATKARLK